MSRLTSTLRLDAMLQARYHVYWIVVGAAVALGAALRAVLTPDELVFFMPVMVMYGVSLTTVFLVGVLILLERGDGTLDVQMVSPLRPGEYLASKIMTLVGLALVESASMAMVAYGPGFSLGWLVLALLASAALASLAVPIVALVYALYLKNKVQALMWLKPVQVWGGASTLLFFVPTPVEWIGSAVGTLYYPQRLFWSASLDQTEWWVMAPGLLIPLAMLWWLVRRFERAVFA